MSSPTSSAPASSTAASDGPVQIRTGSSQYEAWVGAGLLERLPELLERAGLRGRSRVVADETVWRCIRCPVARSTRRWPMPSVCMTG